jgi:hypothetical protein
VAQEVAPVAVARHVEVALQGRSNDEGVVVDHCAWEGGGPRVLVSGPGPRHEAQAPAAARRRGGWPRHEGEE